MIDQEIKQDRIILSGNCYWCVEALFQKIKGCISIAPGFFHFKDTQEISGKVEAVEIIFNSQIISFEDILDVFFTTHNPTLVSWVPQECAFPLNRSSIIYLNEVHKFKSYEYITELKKAYVEPVHTKVLNENCGIFIVLEEDKWNFYKNNPKDGFCVSIINPKIQKLEINLPHLIRK